MKPKVLFLIAFIALVVAFGCVATPTRVAPTSYAPATQVPTQPSGGGVIEGVAAVETVDILILESFPVQVNVVARGNLPDGCTTIGDATQERDGNTFRVTITTVRPADAMCTEALVPFEKVIALDVYGLPAGTYTVDVNGVAAAFELAVDNVPPTEPTQGSIGGKVWHDLCKVPYESVTEPPEGCVMYDEGIKANGLLEEGEPGLAGVEMTLGLGACPAVGLATTTTDGDGLYTFAGLEPGTYCVSSDPLSAVNEVILIPGGWTVPEGGGITVLLGAGEAVTDVNFGWDYQFLP
jgi:inhibitor of cysteine peptidase